MWGGNEFRQRGPYLWVVAKRPLITSNLKQRICWNAGGGGNAAPYMYLWRRRPDPSNRPEVSATRAAGEMKIAHFFCHSPIPARTRGQKGRQPSRKEIAMLSNLYRVIFGRREEPEATAVNLLHRIQKTCVMTAVECQRQAEARRQRVARQR